MAKALLLGLLLWTFGTAAAAPLPDAYLAKRDRHIQAINAPNASPDAATKRNDDALRDLEAMLKGMIGPVAPKGFPASARSNLDTLIEELGYGKLDGLLYETRDGKSSAVVTTTGLLQAWLKGHGNWWPKGRNPPQDVAKALRADEFYTQGISPDAAFASFAEMTVTPPPKAEIAVAHLGLMRQDVTPSMPTEIIVSVVQGERVFILRQPAAVTVEPIAECTAVWKRYDAERESTLKAYKPTGSKKDEALLDKASRLEAKGDEEHRRCFARLIKEQRAYPALLRQAQALADRVPPP